MSWRRRLVMAVWSAWWASLFTALLAAGALSTLILVGVAFEVVFVRGIFPALMARIPDGVED